MSLIVCVCVWYLIERTKIGAYLRAGTENPRIVQALGIDVPLMVTMVYVLGAGPWRRSPACSAAPSYQVQPLMGSNILIVTFAVVVIGGLGSTAGAIATGLLPLGSSRVGQGHLSRDLLHHRLHRHGACSSDAPAGLFGRGRDHVGPKFNAPCAPVSS